MPKLANDGLPEGYFYGEDIRFYKWLARQVPRSGMLVEVGAFLGRSACVAAPILKENGAHMICIDNWLGSFGDETHDISRKVPVFSIFREHLALFDVLEFVEIRTGDSVLAAGEFATGSIDAVFIDANHALAQVQNDLAAWWPKIKKGGILAGHDYYHERGPAHHCAGVKLAVDRAFGVPDCVTGSCWHVQRPLQGKRERDITIGPVPMEGGGGTFPDGRE